jgi:hypothetical protein
MLDGSTQPSPTTPAAMPPATGLPIHDWQFWVATAIAISAAYVVARMILPKSWFPGGKTKGRKVTLTVGGKPVDK